MLAGGVRALYRGVDATTVRGVVLSVSQICSYDQIKQNLKRRGAMEEGLPLHFTASMVAGLVCSVTSNPVGASSASVPANTAVAQAHSCCRRR